jgi:uncharacterized protein (DUF697 family)
MPEGWDVWRILREVDLEAVRKEAERSFRLLVIAEDERDACTLAQLLSGEEGPRHRWVHPFAAGLDTLPGPNPDLAVGLTFHAEPGPRLAIAIERLARERVPVAVVVAASRNAADAVVRPGESARAAVAGLEPRHLAPVAQALVSAAPQKLRLALGRQLPPLRGPLFASLIEATARANALYALGTGVAETVPLLSLPLNVADIVVLTKNQIVMSYRIALAGGRRGTVREVLGQTLGVLGSGFLLRQLARQLVGLVPVIGLAPKVAVAYAGTWAVGRAVAAWTLGGPQVSRESVKRFYNEALERGHQVAAALVAGSRLVRRRRRS